MRGEKKIRLQSLVKMGFLMNEIKDIFKSSNNAIDAVTSKQTSLLSQKMLGFDFESKFMMSKSDEATVYYTTGAIVRSILNQCACKPCEKMLTKNSEDMEVIIDGEVTTEHERFVDLCNRGCLIKPSQPVYVTCSHAWSMYSFIYNNKDLSAILFPSKNARSVFVDTFIIEIKRNPFTQWLMKESCKAGCLFEEKMKKIAISTFNIKAKNYVTAINDEIRESKGAKHKINHKKSINARKLKKLSS